MANRETEILDEALEYLNEGKILNKIKGTINNIINSKIKPKKNVPVSKKSNEDESLSIKCSFENISSKSKFDELFKLEAYCAEGWNIENKEVCESVCRRLALMWNLKGSNNTFECYSCTGDDMNKTYKLTTDNAYPKDLHLFFINWQRLNRTFDASKHKSNDGLNFRYFSDVVDNNARREIEKGNKFYQDYHSVYGDEWFRSTCDTPEGWEWK